MRTPWTNGESDVASRLPDLIVDARAFEKRETNADQAQVAWFDLTPVPKPSPARLPPKAFT